MKKINKKAINVLTTAALVASIAAPMAAGAAGNGTISASNVPTVADSQASDSDAAGATSNAALGTIKITIPAGAVLQNGDKVIVKLPGDVDLYDNNDANELPQDPMDAAGRNVFTVPATITGGQPNPLAGVTLTQTKADETDEFHFEITAGGSATPTTEESVFFVQLGDLEWDDLSDGPLEATLEASPNSAFPTGTVTIGNVSSGKVQVSAGSLDTSNDDFGFTLKLKETVAAALETGAESVKVKLPSGYEWNETEGLRQIRATYGQNIFVDIQTDEDELTIDFRGVITATEDANYNGILDAGEDADGDAVLDRTVVAAATTQASFWEITDLNFQVEDESKVKDGDVTAKITGESDFDVTSLKVSTYGEFGSSATVAEATEVVAGKDEQEIADITIQESIGGTLTNGRTVTLTLPEGARWQPEYDNDVNGDAITTPAGNTDSEEGLQLTFRGYTGTDNRTAKFEVTGTTNSDAGSFTLEDIEVALEADYTGALEVEVAGTAGVTGKLKVAEVKNGVTAAAASAPSVVIGLSDQTAGDITLTETVAETFEDGQSISLDLPNGVYFVGTPDVEVTKGDLRITNVRRTNSDNTVLFDVDGESTEASEIKVSGISLKVDRTVAEGDIKLEVQGLGETSAYSDWSNSNTDASVVIAKVATPAPGDTTGSAKFVIDNATYTVNGVEKTADVAPFIQSGRTFLPIRFVAEALGVSESNIIWNATTKTVTLIKGDRIAQVQVGSKSLVVNGVALPMDVAAFVKDGRTVLPLSFVAQALGADVKWDEATRTVSIN